MAGADQITRVKYFDGEFLRAVDFSAEQTYERDARRRHVLAQHTWGIVTGFELVEVPITGETDFFDVVLMPGMAIDGFGRELVSYHAIRLDPTAFAAFTTVAYQTVWLSYSEDDSGAMPSNWADCQDSEATRTTEGWEIVVTPTPPTHDEITVDGVTADVAPAPAATPTVTPVIAADESVPYQELPESSPGDRWLLRLGTVQWDGGEQQFRTAGTRLMESREYVGAVAATLYTPSTTLDIRQRTAPVDVDAAEFATVEGRLKVQGRIEAEKDVWIDGGMIHFAFPGGEEQSTPITLGRQVPASTSSGSELRLRLGEKPDAGTTLSIGPGDGSTATDIVRISGDDVVAIPDGTLTFEQTTRQMIDLYGTSTAAHQYGIGVQADTAPGGGSPATPSALYQRSGGSFRWFKGGKHDDTGKNGGAGDGGQLQLELDAQGALKFGETTQQMLNLWGENYALGVQPSTLYFRSDSDFCWYRGGTHSDNQDDPGSGGTRGMRLDSTDTLYVGGDLVVWGHAPAIVKVESYQYAKQNAGPDAPVTWTANVSANFTEIYQAFVVLNGFSIWANTSLDFNSYGHNPDVNSIPQHAFVRVVSVVGMIVTLEAFCSESLEAQEADNSILSTLVVIGRQTP
jgi:hypothetical protein